MDCLSDFIVHKVLLVVRLESKLSFSFLVRDPPDNSKSPSANLEPDLKILNRECRLFWQCLSLSVQYVFEPPNELEVTQWLFQGLP